MHTQACTSQDDESDRAAARVGDEFGEHEGRGELLTGYGIHLEKTEMRNV